MNISFFLSRKCLRYKSEYTGFLVTVSLKTLSTEFYFSSLTFHKAAKLSQFLLRQACKQLLTCLFRSIVTLISSLSVLCQNLILFHLPHSTSPSIYSLKLWGKIPASVITLQKRKRKKERTNKRKKRKEFSILTDGF